MNIYASRGHKVRFLDRNGYDNELTEARNLFVKDQILTVDHTEVGSWRTSVVFEEYPGKYFNSVMFEDAA